LRNEIQQIPMHMLSYVPSAHYPNLKTPHMASVLWTPASRRSLP